MSAMRLFCRPDLYGGTAGGNYGLAAQRRVDDRLMENRDAEPTMPTLAGKRYTAVVEGYSYSLSTAR